MEYRQNLKKIYKLAIIASVISIISILVVGIFIIARLSQPTSAVTTKPPTTTQPLFSFMQAEAPDWSKGPSNKTSMALFYKPSDCFVSVEYHDGDIDPAAALQKNQKSLIKDGYSSTPYKVVPTTLKTGMDSHQYDLHQYSVTSPKGMPAMYAAHEFGYVQLEGGYIKAEGYCTGTRDLPATVAALQAIKKQAD